ncbi:outer membrane biosynthesis protein TonB/tetratricopeptide (TPR) repeat protein [Sphingomonas sp. UYAg733]
MLGIMLIAAQAVSPAAAVSPAPVQSAKRSVQQDFEAATALQDAGKHAEALAVWEALEKRIPKNKRSLAIIRVRKATALIGLQRHDDAVAAVRAGLADLPIDDPTLKADRYVGWSNLGRIAEYSLDYASAAEAYRQAEPIASDDLNRVAAFRGLVEAETFVDPDSATRDMARAEAFMAPLKIDARNRAILKRVKSQLLMNQGNYAAAQLEAGAAVKLLGGLTSNTDLYDVAARSNYAIAALLNGKTDEARRYMAMTGAGRLSKGSFDPGPQMKVPDCGGEANLRPEDMAVVELSIGSDGTVSAVPVYAAGGGAVALEFARAVQNWSFDPVQVKTMPTFFRIRMRIELRCSTVFQRPSVGDYLDGDLASWLSSKGIAPPLLANGSDAATLPMLRSQLAAAEARDGKDALPLVPILHLLARNAVVPRQEANGFARRALAIVTTAGAPATARFAIDRIVAASSGAEGWNAKREVKAIMPALSYPAYAADVPARSAIRLMLADAMRTFDENGARIMLKQVGDEPALPANHPLRVGALVRLASLEQANGNVDAARTAFESSGLAANQCALIDAPPRFLHAGGTFPNEARQWGFEGWTQVQFDVAADGKVLNERAIVSYPPFVFTKAGKETLATAKYEKSFRPDGGLGCGGSVQRVKFLIQN